MSRAVAAFVLVVEDEPRLAQLVADCLRAADMEVALLDRGTAATPSCLRCMRACPT